jgi:hypothetical protein
MIDASDIALHRIVMTECICLGALIEQIKRNYRMKVLTAALSSAFDAIRIFDSHVKAQYHANSLAFPFSLSVAPVSLDLGLENAMINSRFVRKSPGIEEIWSRPHAYSLLTGVANAQPRALGMDTASKAMRRGFD